MFNIIAKAKKINMIFITFVLLISLLSSLAVLHEGWKTGVDIDLVGGTYSDPNHPNCKRVVTQLLSNPTPEDSPDFGIKDTITVYGTDPKDATNPVCSIKNSKSFSCPGTIQMMMKKITVDFSSKGGPQALSGSFNETHIEWEDGNVWTKIEGPPTPPTPPGPK